MVQGSGVLGAVSDLLTPAAQTWGSGASGHPRGCAVGLPSWDRNSAGRIGPSGAGGDRGLSSFLSQKGTRKVGWEANSTKWAELGLPFPPPPRL